MSTLTSAGETPAVVQPEARKRGCLFYVRRGLLALVLLLVALPILGIVYQQAAEASDRQTYPAPGQQVDIGGFSLHIHCIGEGSPTVILEAGTGGSSLDWSLVQPAIAQTTRVCAYDREGYGWSDSADHPRSSQQVAADLHTLLTNAHIDGPYILVGHSIGVIHNQAYADQYPDAVAGLLMVDRPPVEYYLNAGLSDDEIVATELGTGALSMARLLTTLGIARLANFVPSPVSGDLPPELRPVYNASAFQTRYYASLMEEYGILGANYRYAAALPPLSSELPLVMLFSDPQASTDPLASEYEQARMAYAARYPRAAVISAEGSNHFIQVQRPDLVIQTLEDLVAAARTGQPLDQ